MRRATRDTYLWTPVRSVPSYLSSREDNNLDRGVSTFYATLDTPIQLRMFDPQMDVGRAGEAEAVKIFRIFLWESINMGLGFYIIVGISLAIWNN